MAREMSKIERRADIPQGAELEPFREVVGLRDTINGLFEDFFSGRPLLVSGPREPSAGERGFIPPVDIRETPLEIVVYAGLFGCKKEDCRIEVKDDMLILSGECKGQESDGQEWIRRELPRGSFYRAFGLPTQVKTDQVKASYHDGLLEIHLPKAENAQARRVEIE